MSGHTGHTGHTGARGHTDHTDEPHNHPPKANDTPARKPRPTQQPQEQLQARSRPLPAADSEEAALSEPDPASTRSQSASPRLLEGIPVKSHWGSRDTLGTHGRKRAHGRHRRTSQPSKPTKTPARQRDDRIQGRIRGLLNSRIPGAERAPRGRLRRGRPQRTRPCRIPLPERLPAPARRRSAK